LTKFQNIQSKLKAFIKKYYTNELIKGMILFFSFGLLYFIFTLFVEYFLWLKPTARTILLITFIIIELALLAKYIIFPLIKLFGLKKGISYKDASKIIGKHFNEVDDKLLNVLQLGDNNDQSELLLASIEQKSINLEPIPFKQAINFSQNKKYLKYLAIPVMIWLITFLTGNNAIFKDSLDRVVHYQTTYEPPAPFSFEITNEQLTAIEGKPFTLQVVTNGNTIPENVKIHFREESYFLKEENLGSFSHTFSNLKENTKFYIEANGIKSKSYEIKVIKTPSISAFKMSLNYPNYTNKKNEKIQNTGNAIVPEGTSISWMINAKNTNKLSLDNLKDTTTVSFKNTKDGFVFSKRIKNNFDYLIKTSNNDLKDYEKLQYAIQVIKDEHPKIIVKTDIDSISRGNAQFVGQLSDDYGISKLQLVYYDKNDKRNNQKYSISTEKSTFQEFYYIFPEGLNLNKGIDYEFYFELFDNDAVNGNKSVKTKVYHYRNKTDQELTEDILKEQKQSLDDLNTTTKSKEKLNKTLEYFSNKIKNKSEMDWQDKKEFNQFIKRQKQYQQMLENNTQKLQNNIDELKQESNPNLEQKKEDLKKRLEEIKDLQKREKLLDELKRLAEKLDKENFLKKLDKLTEKNKQDEKSLERILELTKRFYVEKKAEEIANKLEELAKKQKDLEKDKDNNSDKQKELNDEFDKIKEDLEELSKQNKDLKKPMDLPKTEEEEKSIEEDMQKADEKLEENEEEEKSEQEKKASKETAQKKQKSAARKMKKMSQKMKSSMAAMEGEMFEEDIDNLRAIIENLITFSLEQEQLMESYSRERINSAHPEFSKKLKRQQVLKEHFEHIDDSIYSLSLRMSKLSSKIQKDIIDAHYNIDKSLENIAENKITIGRTNQQYTMTAANNLASFLSDLLDAAQNPMEMDGMGKGKGKGKSKGFSLPDIIKKQSESLSQCKKPGNNPGNKMGKGEKGGKSGEGKKGEKGKSGEGGKGGEGEGSEQMSGEQYEIYKQQNALREAFKSLMDKAGSKGSAGNKALKQMEELEKMLLDKGITNQVIEKMQNIKHELLKLDKANFEQGEDNKRKSDSNKTLFKKRNIKEIKTKKLYFNPNEILNRRPLPLRSNYKKKVQEYFSTK